MRIGLTTPSATVASGNTILEASALTQLYREIREASLELCAPLATEDYVVQSMPDASPAKWHLAHTTWFFEEFVLQHLQQAGAYKFHDPDFRYLFNSYYNAVGPMHNRANRGLLSRPTVDQVFEYRARIDEQMDSLVCQAGGLSPELARIITLGLNHEQQHQELLLTDIKHLFSCNPLLPAYSQQRAGQQQPPPRRAAPPASFRHFAGGLADVGYAAPADAASFCFDNELPRHRVYVAPFQLATRPVTNAEYLEFVRDGGYRNPAHWLADGWLIVQREQWARPIYWAPSLQEEFTLRGLVELDPHTPACHLSYYESDAFARWTGARLPTEFEWEIAAATAPICGNFVESRNWHPVAAATGPTPAAPADEPTLLQLLGDVWEWTQSAYSPYPGYRPASGALGEYNGKFMVNQLVLRGGSCATPRSHIRPTYRNFFNAAARWQFSGVRLARDQQ